LEKTKFEETINDPKRTKDADEGEKRFALRRRVSQKEANVIGRFGTSTYEKEILKKGKRKESRRKGSPKHQRGKKIHPSNLSQ